MLYKCNNFCKPVWKICTPLKGPKSVICNINFWIEMTPLPPWNFSKKSSVLVPWYQLFILQMMCAAIGVCIGGCLSSPGGSTDILPTTLHPPQLHLHILIRFNSIASSFHPSIFYARNKSPKLSFFSLSIPCEPYPAAQY